MYAFFFSFVFLHAKSASNQAIFCKLMMMFGSDYSDTEFNLFTCNLTPYISKRCFTYTDLHVG